MAFLFAASLGIAAFGVCGNILPQEPRFVIVKRDRPFDQSIEDFIRFRTEFPRTLYFISFSDPSAARPSCAADSHLRRTPRCTT
jgi:hypothetical protein